MLFINIYHSFFLLWKRLFSFFHFDFFFFHIHAIGNTKTQTCNIKRLFTCDTALTTSTRQRTSIDQPITSWTASFYFFIQQLLFAYIPSGPEDLDFFRVRIRVGTRLVLRPLKPFVNEWDMGMFSYVGFSFSLLIPFL